MTVLLNKAYGGYATGTIVKLPADTETALIAQGLAATNAGPSTSGAVTTTYSSGSVTCPIGVASVVVSNANISANSKVFAVVAQAAADGTALRVERVVCAAGSATLYLTANATAATVIDWILFP